MTRQLRDVPTRNRAIDSSGAAGRRQPHAAGIATGLRRDALQRDGQVGPALRRRQGVDLVDDQVLDGPPVAPPAVLAQEQREALGRGDQDVRRVVAELAALVGRGIPGAHADPDRAGVQVQPAGDPLQRRGEVALDVVVEAPQGRDVDAPQAGAERPGLRARGTSRSSTARKAASVLPVPVGAISRTFSPAAIGGQARSWPGVGPSGNAALEPGADRLRQSATASRSPAGFPVEPSTPP